MTRFPDRGQAAKAFFGKSIAPYSLKGNQEKSRSRVAFAYATRPSRPPKRCRRLRLEGGTSAPSNPYSKYGTKTQPRGWRHDHTDTTRPCQYPPLLCFAVTNNEPIASQNTEQNADSFNDKLGVMSMTRTPSPVYRRILFVNRSKQQAHTAATQSNGGPAQRMWGQENGKMAPSHRPTPTT